MRPIFTLLLTVSLLAISGHSQAATLLGRYSFESDSGASIINDATGLADATNGANSGADSADSTLVDTASNNYRSFDGTDYINQPNFISGLASYSIATWLQTTTSSSSITIVGASNTYALSINDAGGGTGKVGSGIGQLRFSQHTSGWDTAIYSNATNVNNGGWHFVVVTYDGSSVKMYVDGSLQTNVNSTASGTVSTGNDELIGAYYQNNANKWSGNLDDVRYYSGALTGSEITTIYNDTVSIHPVPEPGTLALLGLGGIALILSRRRQTP